MTEAEACTKSKIINAGMEAMVNKSYNSVGLNEILKSVGVPKGSFYHYFKSKEELGVAVIEQLAENQRKYSGDFFKNKKLTPTERLRSFFQWQIDMAKECDYQRKCLVSKLTLEMGCMSNPMRNALKYCMDQLILDTSRCIQEGQDSGEFTSAKNAEELSEFICSAWEGAMVRMQADKSTKAADDFLNIVFNLVLAPKS